MPEPLDPFPIQRVIDAGVAATNQVHDEANKMMRTALDRNQDEHVLLVPNCLPKPGEVEKNEFAKAYEQQVLSDERFRGEVTGIIPVNTDDIKAAMIKLDEQLKHNIVVQSPITHTDDPDSVKKYQDESAHQTGMLPAKMQTQRAQTGLIYLVPGALQYDPNIQKIGTSTAAKIADPGPELMWPAQLDLWVYDDVCKAIAHGNRANLAPGEPLNVQHSLFKQLASCSEPVLVAATSDADANAGLVDSVPFEPAVSATGRVSNALYSVYSFQLVLDIETERLPAALRALETGQFITIRTVDQVQLLDLPTMAKMGFIYGDKPVVRVWLTCEELFLKDWFKKYTEGLNIQPPTPSTGSPGTGGPGMGSPVGMPGIGGPIPYPPMMPPRSR